MTSPDGCPEHVRLALLAYDWTVKQTQEEVVRKLPSLRYRRLLEMHRDLESAAVRLCHEMFGSGSKLVAVGSPGYHVGTQEANAAILWVGRAVGRRVDPPRTDAARVALAVDLWIARHQ